MKRGSAYSIYVFPSHLNSSRHLSTYLQEEGKVDNDQLASSFLPYRSLDL